MSDIWKDDVNTFLRLADKYQVRMLMVGGGAVNFYGYQRHSADVDFWLDTKPKNLQRLIRVLREMGFDIQDFPESVKNRKQNISIKFSPTDLDVELITRFSVNKSFDEALQSADTVRIGDIDVYRYYVLSLEDLITAKTKSDRIKDRLDVIELKRIHNL